MRANLTRGTPHGTDRGAGFHEQAETAVPHKAVRAAVELANFFPSRKSVFTRRGLWQTTAASFA
jgi:hypothetical protein